jgi:murein DD-endopeptidase MepM/ murein hydrolase activator NlpD
VRQGEAVSRVGRTGRTTGANLHFEIRSRNIARNPLFYLPPWPGL